MNVSAAGAAVVVFSQQPSLPSFCLVLNTQKWQSTPQASWQLAASCAAALNVSGILAVVASAASVVAAAAYATGESGLELLMAMLLYGSTELKLGTQSVESVAKAGLVYLQPKKQKQQQQHSTCPSCHRAHV
jgi:hypothetical protein